LKADSANAAADKSYRFAFQNIPTPLESIGGYTYPLLLVPTKGTTTVTKRTCVGSMNTTYYGFGREASKTYIKWA